MLRLQLIRGPQSAHPARHQLRHTLVTVQSASSALLTSTPILHSFYRILPVDSNKPSATPSPPSRSLPAVTGTYHATSYNNRKSNNDSGIKDEFGEEHKAVVHPHLHKWRDKQQNISSRGGGDHNRDHRKNGPLSGGSTDVYKASRAMSDTHASLKGRKETTIPEINQRDTASAERTTKPERRMGKPERHVGMERQWPRSGRDRQRANKKKGFNRHHGDGDDFNTAAPHLLRASVPKKVVSSSPISPRPNTTKVPPLNTAATATSTEFNTPSIEDILGLGLLASPTISSAPTTSSSSTGRVEQSTNTKVPQRPQQQTVTLTLEVAAESLRVHPTSTIVSNSLALVQCALDRLDTHAASLLVTSISPEESEHQQQESEHANEHNAAVIRAAHVEIKTLCIKIDALVQELVSVRGDLEEMIELCGEWDRHLCTATDTTTTSPQAPPPAASSGDKEEDLARRFTMRMTAVIQRHISKRSLIGTLRQIIQKHPHQRRPIMKNNDSAASSPPTKWDPIYHGSIIRTLLKELSEIDQYKNSDSSNQQQKSMSTMDTWPLSLLLMCLVAVQSEKKFLAIVEKYPWVVVSALGGGGEEKEGSREVALSLLKWLETVHWSMRRYDPASRLSHSFQQLYHHHKVTSSCEASSPFVQSSLLSGKREVEGSTLYDSADPAIHDFAEEHNKLTFGSQQQQQQTPTTDSNTGTSKRPRGALRGYGTEGSGTTEVLPRDVLPHKNIIEVDAETGEILRIVEGRGDARTIERDYFIADLTATLLKSTAAFTLQHKKNNNYEDTCCTRKQQGEFWAALCSLTFQLVGKSSCSGGRNSTAFSNHAATTSSLIQQLSAAAGIHVRDIGNTSATDLPHKQRDYTEAQLNQYMASEIKRAMELGVMEKRRREADYLSRTALSASEQRAFPYEWSPDSSSPPALWMSENVNGIHTSEWIRDSVLQPLSRIMEMWGSTTFASATTKPPNTIITPRTTANNDLLLDVDSNVVSKFIDDLKHQRAAVPIIASSSSHITHNSEVVSMFTTLGLLLAAYTESLLVTAKRFAMVGLRPSNNRNTIDFTLLEHEQPPPCDDDLDDDDQNQNMATHSDDNEEEGVEKTPLIESVVNSHENEDASVDCISGTALDRIEMVEASEVISIFGDRSFIPSHKNSENNVERSIIGGSNQQDRLKQHRARVMKTNLKELSSKSSSKSSSNSSSGTPDKQQRPIKSTDDPPSPTVVVSSNCRIKLHSKDTYDAIRKVSLVHTTRTSNGPSAPTTTTAEENISSRSREEEDGSDRTLGMDAPIKKEDQKLSSPPGLAGSWDEADTLESFLFSKEELSTLLPPSQHQRGSDNREKQADNARKADHIRKQKKRLQERRRKAEKTLVQLVLGGGNDTAADHFNHSSQLPTTTSTQSSILPLGEYITPLARSMGSEVRSREIQAAKFLEMPLETGSSNIGDRSEESRVQIPILKRPSIKHLSVHNGNKNKESKPQTTKIVRLTVYSPKYHPRLPRTNTTSTTDYFAQGGAPAPPFFYKVVKYAMEKAALPWDRTLEAPSALQKTIHTICDGGVDSESNFLSERNNDASDPLYEKEEGITNQVKSGDVLSILLHIHHNRQFVSGEVMSSSPTQTNSTSTPIAVEQQYGLLEGRNMERTFDTTFGFLTIRENVRGRKYLPRSLSELLRTADDAVLVTSLASNFGKIMSQHQSEDKQDGHQQPGASIFPMPSSMLTLLVGTSPYAPPRGCQLVLNLFGHREEQQPTSPSPTVITTKSPSPPLHSSWLKFTRSLILGQRSILLASNTVTTRTRQRRQLPSSVLDAALSAFLTSAMYQTYFNIEALNYTDEDAAFPSTQPREASPFISSPMNGDDDGDDLAELLNAAATEQQQQTVVVASGNGNDVSSPADDVGGTDDLQYIQRTMYDEEDEVEMGATEAYWRVHEWQQEINRLPAQSSSSSTTTPVGVVPLAQQWEGWTEGRRSNTTRAPTLSPSSTNPISVNSAQTQSSYSSSRHELAPSLWGAIREIRFGGGKTGRNLALSKRDFANRLDFTQLRNVSVFAVFGLVSEPLAWWAGEVLGSGNATQYSAGAAQSFQLSVSAAKLMLASASAPQVMTEYTSMSSVATSILRNSRYTTSKSTYSCNARSSPSDAIYSHVRETCLHPLLFPQPLRSSQRQQQQQHATLAQPTTTTTPTLETLVSLIPSINDYHHNNDHNSPSLTNNTVTRSSLAVQGAVIKSARLRGCGSTFADEVLRSYAHVATTTTTAEASLPFDRIKAAVALQRQQEIGSTSISLSGTSLMTVDKILKAEERLLLLLGLNVHHGLIEAAAAKGDFPLCIHFLSLLTSASSQGVIERRHERGGGGGSRRGLSCSAVLGASGPAVEGIWVAIGTMIQHGHTAAAEQMLTLLQQCATLSKDESCTGDGTSVNWGVSPIFSGAYRELATHLHSHSGGLSSLNVPTADILFPSLGTQQESRKSRSSTNSGKAVAAVYEARLRNVVTRSFGQREDNGAWCTGGLVALQLAVSLFTHHQLGGRREEKEVSPSNISDAPSSSSMLRNCLRYLSDLSLTVPSPPSNHHNTNSTTTPLLSLDSLLQTISDKSGDGGGGGGRKGSNYRTHTSPLHPSHPCLPILTDALKMYCCIIGSLPSEAQARVLWTTNEQRDTNKATGNTIKSSQTTNYLTPSSSPPLSYCSRTGTFISTAHHSTSNSSRIRDNKERVREARRMAMMQVEMNQQGGKQSMFGVVSQTDNDDSAVVVSSGSEEGVSSVETDKEDAHRIQRLEELLTAPSTISALMPLRSTVTITVFDHVHLLSNGIIIILPPSPSSDTSPAGRYHRGVTSTRERHHHQYSPLQFIPKGDYAFRGDVLSPVGDHKTLDVLHGAAAELFMHLLLSQIANIERSGRNSENNNQQQEQLTELVRGFGATAAASNELFSGLAFTYHPRQ